MKRNAYALEAEKSNQLIMKKSNTFAISNIFKIVGNDALNRQK